jgi:hypothetical protein
VGGYMEDRYTSNEGEVDVETRQHDEGGTNACL